MGVIVVRGKSGAGGGTGVYSQAEKLALELEMSFKAANLSNYKEFTYTAGDLTGIDIYEDDTKAVKLFNKIFTCISGTLTQLVLTRVSDSATLTKDFNYDINENLESIKVTI